MHDTFSIYIILLLVILFLIMLAQKLKVSYPIVLVLGGLALSFFPWLPEIKIDPDLIFVIFLPPLLYEAAWHTSWKEFWKWRRVISSFAFLIVILTSCVIAFVSSSLIPGFTLALGFLLGGIISPPDAVSATSIMKQIKVPRRLVTIIEGESLLNDAASLIVFRFAMAAVDSGEFVFKDAVFSFFVVIVMGIATGIAIAMVFYAIHRWLPVTANINTLFTLIAPYIMYIAAEQMHFSGVLSVVSGGLFLSIRSHRIFDHRSRLRTENVWSALSFGLNGIVFMLIGLELPVIIAELGDTSLSEAIKYGLIITGVLIIVRLLSTLGASAFTVVISRFITTADNRPGWRGPLIFGWAGMRGVVSLAAALSIPVYLTNGQAFPQRNLILFITFIVILVTLVFQGLTLPALVKWLKVEDRDETIPKERQESIIQKKLAVAALKVLDGKYADAVNKDEILQSIKLKHSGNARLFEGRLAEHSIDRPITDEEYRKIIAEVVLAQRELLHQLNRKQEIDEEVIRKYNAILDLEEENFSVRFSKNAD
ncbi:Na+/H+ antiporter [Terrimonas sp. NA20]|uniref:Na+/H+ antiporter n=1 Tax=Terrimonas ginsenosidimutans TaxID=2908004 RepID=A0ABS9KKK9_9BACT|nr:Na+/H+ antiporter [Terrimonas ginsenosidimutans]MCG2612856.1 Na+/H+ antiporter [Terrimonas ginsenosidimutans]